MDVTVVIATCGDAKWAQLANERAFPSASAETPNVIRVDSPTSTLAEVRNAGLGHVTTDWVCFLDADDELEPGYLDAVARGSADVRAPAVRYVPWHANISADAPARAEPRARVPRVAGHQRHACTVECLAYGNWLVIGSVIRTELVREAGGFREWPVYEDWALFARVAQLGATFEAVPAAVYRAHVQSTSRNRGQLSARRKLEVHRDIARSLGLPVPA